MRKTQLTKLIYPRQMDGLLYSLNKYIFELWVNGYITDSQINEIKEKLTIENLTKKLRDTTGGNHEICSRV